MRQKLEESNVFFYELLYQEETDEFLELLAFFRFVVINSNFVQDPKIVKHCTRLPSPLNFALLIRQSVMCQMKYTI